MILRPLAKGLLTFLPGSPRILPKRTAGPDKSALHCYERWLKHLTLLSAHGMAGVPRSLVELGPGDTLGVGLAALLSGVDEYYALDVVRYADPAHDLQIFEELVTLFETRAGRPSKGWPDYENLLDRQLFPSHILTEKVLGRALQPQRVEAIRQMLRAPHAGGRGGMAIHYIAPWTEQAVPLRGSLDAVISHTVLQHVSDLEGTYRAIAGWLKLGGIMSHQIDFGCMGMAREWNWHWGCSDFLWKIIAGRRAYLINRQPCSAHLKLMEKHGFRTSCVLKYHRTDGIHRARLSAPWRHLDDDDLTCSGAFVVAGRAAG